MGAISVPRARDVSKCANVRATRKTGGTKIVVNAAPTGTKSVHAFATGTPELRVKTLALRGKERM